MSYKKRSSRNRFDIEAVMGIFSIIIIIVLAFVLCGRSVDKAYNRYEVTATVTDKAIKNGKDSGKYLVYATTTEDEIVVMEITDSLLAARWDSSDVYAGIEVGITYEFTVGGKRVPFMSWYPNIYEYKKIG